jgi:hypothetical protein
MHKRRWPWRTRWCSWIRKWKRRRRNWHRELKFWTWRKSKNSCRKRCRTCVSTTGARQSSLIRWRAGWPSLKPGQKESAAWLRESEGEKWDIVWVLWDTVSNRPPSKQGGLDYNLQVCVFARGGGWIFWRWISASAGLVNLIV